MEAWPTIFDLQSDPSLNLQFDSHFQELLKKVKKGGRSPGWVSKDNLILLCKEKATSPCIEPFWKIMILHSAKGTEKGEALHKILSQDFVQTSGFKSRKHAMQYLQSILPANLSIDFSSLTHYFGTIWSLDEEGIRFYREEEGWNFFIRDTDTCVQCQTKTFKRAFEIWYIEYYMPALNRSSFDLDDF